MKKFWILWSFLCSILILSALAACGQTEPAAEASGLTDVPVAAEPSSSSAETDSVVSSSAIDTSDLTLIGETGRPQFLNAYASW